MRNLLVFTFFCVILGSAMVIGFAQTEKKRSDVSPLEKNIPSIGRIEILNGCGVAGAATIVADYLRQEGFDVKATGNSETFNYPFTIITSHTADMTCAQQVCDVLNTDKLILVRTDEDLYNVTVYVGNDFQELVE